MTVKSCVNAAQRFEMPGILLDEASIGKNVFGSLRLLPPCFSLVADMSSVLNLQINSDMFRTWFGITVVVIPKPL